MSDPGPTADQPSGPDHATSVNGLAVLAKAFYLTGLVFFVFVLLIYGANVLIPVATALLLWFFINALANGFERLWSPWLGSMRGLAIVLALISLILASLFIIDLVVSNVRSISANAADFQRSINLLIDRVASLSGMEQQDIVKALLDQLRFDELLGTIVSAMAGIGSQLGVIFIYVMFMLVEQQVFDAKLNALVRDPARRQQIRLILERVGHDVQSYLWLMTLISLLTAGLSYVVMVSVGLDQPAFWALLIFILNFIPTIGSIVATALPSLYSLLQFGDLWPFLVLLVAIGTIQFLIGNILQPRLAANTLNLSQFVVILSLFIWGAIWGVVGMFLAVPITSIAMIVCSNVPALRSVAIILSGSGQAASGEVMTEAPVQSG